jgi:hypothetical protein
MSEQPTTRGGRRPGAGRKRENRIKKQVSLSPEVWGFLAAIAGSDKRRGVSGAVEDVVRASHFFPGWQAKQSM